MHCLSGEVSSRCKLAVFFSRQDVTSEIDPEVVSDPLPDGRVHRLLHPAPALHSYKHRSFI